jgi:hypothetical protein
MSVTLTSTGVTYPDASAQVGPAAQQLLSKTTISGSPTYVDLSVSTSDGYSSYLLVLDSVRNVAGTNVAIYLQGRTSSGAFASATTRNVYNTAVVTQGINSTAPGTPTSVYGTTSMTGLNYPDGLSGQFILSLNATKQAGVLSGYGTYRAGSAAALGFEMAQEIYTNNSGQTIANVRISTALSIAFAGGTIWFYGIK